eukprot:symbB.v1.2.023676.t1/scaffold2185.1/size86375/2
MVDIRPNLLRVRVINTWLKVTHYFQWHNFWGTILPDQSKYHLSNDAKRIVVRLRKVHDSLVAGPWCSFFDVRTGSVCLEEHRWPAILQELQGAWRSDDEEPIEVVGDQVIWPQGSRDTLMVEEESLILQQVGDANKVPNSECRGFYQRESFKICWEDDDSWCRIPGLALERKESGHEALPLHYDGTLARWLPWLPKEEFTRQTCRWLPSLSSEVLVEVQMEELQQCEVTLCGDLQLQSLKLQLLQTLEETNSQGVCLADAEALPMDLLRRCRVCALATQEVGFEREALAETLLALRRGQPLSPACEVAALGGLSRWLQWLRSWIPPGSRQNLDAALENLKERQLQASKKERKTAIQQDAARWPPVWSCKMVDGHEVLQDATERLMLELRNISRLKPHEESSTLFAQARRRVAEDLAKIEIPTTRRRCDGLARRWVRTLWTGASSTARSFRQSLREGGLSIMEDVVDWSVLLKSRSEVARIMEELQAQSYLELQEGKIQDLGCQALATCVALLEQLQWSLSDNSWNKADQVPGFRRCRWISSGEVLLWQASSKAEASLPTIQNESNLEVSRSHVLAVLFLNTPCWHPDWAGALRCRDSARGLSRDILGDGGRLVVIEEAKMSIEWLAPLQTRTVRCPLSALVFFSPWTFFLAQKYCRDLCFFRFVNSTLLSWVVWLIFLGEFWIVGNTMIGIVGHVIFISLSLLMFALLVVWVIQQAMPRPGKKKMDFSRIPRKIQVSKEETCAICLEGICGVGSQLCCQHVFHEKCLLDWWNTSCQGRKNVVPLCPLCRRAASTSLGRTEL